MTRSFDLPATLEAVRGECANRTASFAHARYGQASTNADPLSTQRLACTPRAASARPKADDVLANPNR